MTAVSEETKKRHGKLAAEAKYHPETLAATVATQVEENTAPLLAEEFTRLEQSFVGANTSNHAQDEQIAESKVEQTSKID